MPRPSRRSLLAWTPVALLGAAALLRVAGADRVLPIAPLMAVTPYLAVLSVLAVVLALALRRRAAALAALAVAAVLAAVVLPRAFAGGQAGEPRNGRELTVMTANLHLGRADAGEIVRLVR